MECWNQPVLERASEGESSARMLSNAFPSHRMVRLGARILACMWVAAGVLAQLPASGAEPITFIVMDPLAKELACACVKGYGQRDYRKLAARFQASVKQRVSIEFSDDLAESMVGVSPGREVIVAGDQSLVLLGAKKAGLKCHPVSDLTGLDGKTSFNGLFIARSDDPAKELKDVAGRKLFFGLVNADQNRAAALASLRASGVEPAGKLEQRGSYSEAALDVLDSVLSPPPVAVIPSYALPLLEGCGSVKPGNLKVIGTTQPMPFIEVFLSDNIPAERQKKILKALLSIKSDAKFLKAMESRDGFTPLNASESDGSKASASPAWPDWRGPGRDAHVPRLPARLPAAVKFVWKKPAMNGALAGLSISAKRLILAERDFAEEHDVYRCLNADDGELMWRVEFPTHGTLDYGQFPRATPVIYAGRAYLLGAFGDLRCVNLSNGKVLWERALPHDFKATLPTWGMCSTPLIVDDLVIVNPGGMNASLAALDCLTGRTRWTTPGSPAAYSSFICGEFGMRRQIVGYDQHSLGGWDVKTGKRLWQLVPPAEGDFNVPTPIAVDGSVLVATENNGTRLYRFDESGTIITKPAAQYADLAPDAISPVVTRGRVFGASSGLHCLDVRNGLKPVWHQDEEALGDYVTFIADDERVLVITLRGELILLDAKADTCAIISRLRIFDGDVEVYSYPALLGTRIYARGGSSVVCVDLGTD